MHIRLLHIADLHLDRAFAGLGCEADVARRRRQGLRDALMRAGSLAQERACHAVTIGGDLFENDRAGADTAHFLAETFRSWRPLRVFIAPGNHDALLPGSLYERTQWPANVHIFSTPELEPVSLNGITLWGLGHREMSWQGDPLARAVTGDGPHIALFHGAEMGSRPDGKSVHGPFHAADIRRRGFAAALCGHYHQRRMDSATGLVYPGTPEPLTFADEGGRGGVLVSIDEDGAVDFEAVDFNRWSMRTITADLTAVRTRDAAIDTVAAEVQAATAGGDVASTVVRVDLTGEVAATMSLDATLIEMGLRERVPFNRLAGLRVRDLTRVEVDVVAAMNERSARGAFARTAVEARDAARAAGDEDEAALLDDALRYGLMALAGAEVGLR